jgi:GST-like protein
LAVGKELSSDPATLAPEEIERRAKLLYNQRARPAPGTVA